MGRGCGRALQRPVAASRRELKWIGKRWRQEMKHCQDWFYSAKKRKNTKERKRRSRRTAQNTATEQWAQVRIRLRSSTPWLNEYDTCNDCNTSYYLQLSGHLKKSHSFSVVHAGLLRARSGSGVLPKSAVTDRRVVSVIFTSSVLNLSSQL